MYFKSGLGSHPVDYLSTSPSFYGSAPPVSHPAGTASSYVENRPVSIGNDVWIGSGVTVLDGVTIGDGAILAAGSVVTKDVAPYSIVAGIPGHVIGVRFDDAVVRRLLALRWWNYDLTGVDPDVVSDIFHGKLTLEKCERLEILCRNLTLMEGV